MPERTEESGAVAVTREVGPGIGRCELTHRSREPIDLDLATGQHRSYGVGDRTCRSPVFAARAGGGA